MSRRSRSTSRRRRPGRQRTRLQLERLEVRQLLTTLTVTTTVDEVDVSPGDGLCQIQTGGCSLRAAIQEANALGAQAGPHEIVLPAGLFLLTRPGTDEEDALTGDLNVRTSLSILGAGSTETTIDGGQLDRVLDIRAGTVDIRGVTIRGGKVDADEEAFEFIGGGIRNQADLTLVDSVITGNVAGSGGGLANYDGATMRLLRSVITGNGDVSTTRGGGIFNYSAYEPTNLEITESTIAGNQAATGGGVMNFSRDGLASAVIQRSTVSGNSAFQGGGITNRGTILYGDTSSAVLSLRNSTISGNTAEASGGGILNESFYDASADADILNSTLTDNVAQGLDGGGIHSFDLPTNTTLVRSTIVAGNRSGRDGHDLFGETITGTFNLIGSSSGNQFADGVDNNLVDLDPQLGPLEDNGGPTKTHALLDGSPAIDQGINSLMLANDQRSSAFRRIVDLTTLSNAADGTDIGAVEVGQVAAEFDYGDAPDGVTVDGILRRYPTLSANQAARHRIDANGPYLGVMPPDADVDGQSSQQANGDDLIGSDDEDGITTDPIQVTPGQPIAGAVIHHNGADVGALLNVWLDWNLDGDWDDAGEQLVTDRAVSPGQGSTSLADVTLPPSATRGTSFLRVRLSTQPGLEPRGDASDGEVEDYRVVIGDLPAPMADLSLRQIVDSANPVIGQRVTFTITVTNAGPDPATNVEVTNLLPLELIFEQATVTQGTYEFEETWSLPVLQPGTSAELRIEATVDSSDSIQHVAEITASDQLDPDSTPGNGISGEDDQASVTLGTCLSGGPLHAGINRLTFSCASPGGWVGFVHGTTRGTKTFDQYNVTVDIADADGVAIAIADADGIASALIELSEDDWLAVEQETGDLLILAQAFEMLPRRTKSNTLAITEAVEMLRTRQQGTGAVPIRRDVIESIVAAATTRWLGLPLPAAERERLFTTQIVISDLPDGAVARTVGRTIVLDHDAAGHGWYLDPSPLDNREFVPSSWRGQLDAIAPAATDRIDLLSTLMHEQGHVMGLAHSVAIDGVMHPWMDPGIRRIPIPDTNPLLAFDVNGDQRVSAGDALQVINWLGRRSLSGNPASTLWLGATIGNGESTHLDANGDYRVSAGDALAIINYLAKQQVDDVPQGEAEQVSLSLRDPSFSHPTLSMLALSNLAPVRRIEPVETQQQEWTERRTISAANMQRERQFSLALPIADAIESRSIGSPKARELSDANDDALLQVVFELETRRFLNRR